MRTVFLPLFVFFALSAFAKGKTESAPQLMDKGKALDEGGDPESAKKIYYQVLESFSHELVSGAAAEDENLGGAAPNMTYGDLANHELKFIDLEIIEGKSRIFKDPKKALNDILEYIEINEIKELRDKMWVRMKMGACGSDPGELTPDEAMEELRQEFAPKNVKVKNLSTGTNQAPTLKIGLKTDRFLEIRLSKYGKGWIWNQTTTCAKAL